MKEEKATMSAEENKERKGFMSEQKSAAEMVAEAKGHVENLKDVSVVRGRTSSFL